MSNDLTTIQFETTDSLKRKFKSAIANDKLTIREAGEELINLYLKGQVKINTQSA